MEDYLWRKSYPAGVPYGIEVEHASLADCFRGSAARFADEAYAICGEEGRSYGEVNRSACLLANELMARGAKKGSRVALLVGGKLDYLTAVHACYKAGLVIVPLNPNYTEREFCHILKSGKCDFVVYDKAAARRLPEDRLNLAIRAFSEDLGRARDEAPRLPFAYELGELMASADDDREPEVEVGLDDLAVIQYTGGSSGVPKGCLLTNRNLLISARSWELWYGRSLAEGERPRMFCVAPQYHIFGLVSSINYAMLAGGTQVLCETARPADVMETLRRLKPNLLYAVPTTIIDLIALPGFLDGDYSFLRGAAVGASQLPVSVAREFAEATGVSVVTGYGLSEAGGCVSGELPDVPKAPGSVGLPASGVCIRIAELEGDGFLAYGEEGEIVMCGDQIMSRYAADHDNEGAFIDDVWFRTGDIGYFDAAGNLFISGRKKEMIIRGGFNVWPNEIDAVLGAHELVDEACTVGVPDPRSGETVVSFVKMKEGASFDPDELAAHCRRSLTGYKVPSEICAIKSLPRTLAGKPDRKALREMRLEGVL